MQKKLHKIITGQATSDGAGVKLTRVIGQAELKMLDPFLLLDAFRSNNPNDYIAGFPSHPHRGFETVTYMIEGKMRHKDNRGNEGVIKAGGVQWMTAGKGIIHSEMPEQTQGLLEGFQLWINLPSSHKMDEPSYQEYVADDIPTEKRQGTFIKVIAGLTSQGTQGPIKQDLTNPLYLDVKLQNDEVFFETMPVENNSFIYIIQGSVSIKDKNENPAVLIKDQLALLTEGDEIELSAVKDARFLLISGKPLKEPVSRAGPFVMNTKEEISQAFLDYENGDF